MGDFKLLMEPGEVVVPDDVKFNGFKEICTDCRAEFGWHEEYSKNHTKIWSKKAANLSDFKILKVCIIFTLSIL